LARALKQALPVICLHHVGAIARHVGCQEQFKREKAPEDDS
jgi:hypothetical protein